MVEFHQIARTSRTALKIRAISSPTAVDPHSVRGIPLSQRQPDCASLQDHRVLRLLRFDAFWLYPRSTPCMTSISFGQDTVILSHSAFEMAPNWLHMDTFTTSTRSTLSTIIYYILLLFAKYVNVALNPLNNL